MNNLKCVIVEDQPPAQRILAKYITETDGLCFVKVFSDVVKADEYLNANEVDILFLDINLPKISGIEFLRQGVNCSYIVLTTAYSEYALESYEYNVIDYLLKPFSFERFTKAIEKIKEVKDKNKDDEFICFKVGIDLIKIRIDEIVYIGADSDYTEVFTLGKKYLSSETLKEWNSKLENSFCQIHKSYLVNLKHVVKVSQNKVYLGTKKHLPLGRSFKKKMIERLSS